MTEIIVPLPDDLRTDAENAARAKGVALDEFVRTCLANTLRRSRANDPFFADLEVFRGDAPSDLSVRHDDYLYGEEK